MNILRIAFKNIQQTIRRPTGLLLLTLGPIVLMLILGQAFAVIFSAGQVDLEMDIGYFGKEKGDLYAGFKMFIGELDNFKLTSEETKSITKGEEKTRQGEYQAFIIVDEKNKCLELILNNNSGIHAGIIEGIINGFLDRFNFVNLILRHKPEAIDSMFTSGEADFVSHTSLNASRQPRAIDYFGITIMTMGVLFGAMIGANAVTKEKTLRTLYRIYTTPVSGIEFLLGTCFGTFFALLIQLSSLFLITRYVLHVYYGENILPAIVLLLSESFFALALGVGIASLVESSKTASGLLSGFVPLLIFLGGGYMRLPDTKVFEILSSFSPVGWINKALFEVIYGTGHTRFLPAVLICLVTGTLLLGMAVIKQARRESL